MSYGCSTRVQQWWYTARGNAVSRQIGGYTEGGGTKEKGEGQGIGLCVNRGSDVKYDDRNKATQTSLTWVIRWDSRYMESTETLYWPVRYMYLTEISELILSQREDDKTVRQTARERLQCAQLIVVQKQRLQWKMRWSMTTRYQPRMTMDQTCEMLKKFTERLCYHYCCFVSTST